MPARLPFPTIRNVILFGAAKILLKSGTFRRHMGAIDPDLDPAFLRAARLLKGASEAEAVFARDLISGSGSYSQFHQDLWVLHETARKRGGYFVEFGATDGRSLSNTFKLESEFAWTGILAEPNPVWHESLKQNRTADLDFRCVYRATGLRVPFSATKYPALSTIAGYENADGHRLARREHDIIEVETVSLGDLLEQHRAPREIDYISVDTEGSELAILEQFDFHRWNVTLFSVEHNATAQEPLLDRLMEDRGYERRYPSYCAIESWYKKAG